ncbi:MAG: hypothetical protein WAL37_02370 [Xanthobacteraceae bacterium]
MQASTEEYIAAQLTEQLLPMASGRNSGYPGYGYSSYGYPASGYGSYYASATGYPGYGSYGYRPGYRAARRVAIHNARWH